MRGIAAGLVLCGLASCIDADATDMDPGDSGTAAYASYTRTRHPIVLVPGLMGFDDLIGVVHYFEGIPAALEQGGATVFVAETAQAASATQIGAELIPQLEAFLEDSGAEKLNLIGHSAGAQAARYVAAVRPDLVASVTSVRRVIPDALPTSERIAVAPRRVDRLMARSPHEACALACPTCQACR